MRFAQELIERLDQISPYPLFYKFIMSKGEKKLFDNVIKESSNYLEFGMGGSTLRALQKSETKIYTVESSIEWINYMRKYKLIKRFENKRLFVFPVDIGPTGKWGYPTSDNYRNCFPNYSSYIFKVIDSKVIDLALIDGRFRVACTLKVILKCYTNNNLKILIHDFWNRERYHVVLKYLTIVDKVDTLGLFSIKNNIDLQAIKKDYDIYKFNPA